MSLLYQIISEYIDGLIEKKRIQMKRIESVCDVIHNQSIIKKLNSLKQDINYLKVVKYKLKEYFVFIQDIENSSQM